MHRITAALGVLSLMMSLCLSARGADAPPVADGQWVPIFNGKDLEGWTPKIKGFPAGENFADTFRVADGMLSVRYDKYTGPFKGRFGHLFWKEPLSNYRLRIEYRFVGDQYEGGPDWALRNSGVMIHCEPPDSMRVDQDFPVCCEVQFLGGDGTTPRSTCNVCTPGTNVVYQGKFTTDHIINSSSDTFHGDQWVTAEVEVHGGKVIRHFVNGKQVIEYAEPSLDPADPDGKRLLDAGNPKLVTSGYISLQAESHPIDFRKVELMKLAE